MCGSRWRMYLDFKSSPRVKKYEGERRKLDIKSNLRIIVLGTKTVSHFFKYKIVKKIAQYHK